MRALRIAFLSGCALLAACGGDKAAANGAQGEEVLPKPAAAGRSVTGMPDPGVASARPAPNEDEATDIVELPEDADAVDPASSDDAGDAGEDAPVEAPQQPLAEPPATQQPVEPAAPPANAAAATQPAGSP